MNVDLFLSCTSIAQIKKKWISLKGKVTQVQFLITFGNQNLHWL
jgi:hypothetical protein